jgi:hypothetical protein
MEYSDEEYEKFYKEHEEFVNHLKKETEIYEKKIIFHKVFTVFYSVLFIYFLDNSGFFIPKYVTLPISTLMIVFHFLLFRKYEWMNQMFGYSPDKFDYFDEFED